MSWSHLNLFVGSVLFYDITIYFLYIAFGFFLIPMEHNFMEKKKRERFFFFFSKNKLPLVKAMYKGNTKFSTAQGLNFVFPLRP
mgnify:CR=1 FL=1